VEIAGNTFLLIGGAGFVGSHIVDQLLSYSPKEIIILDNFVRGQRKNIAHHLDNPVVRVIDGSITDGALVRQVVKQANGIFLLAALWLGECETDPRAAVDVNIVGTYNVIEAARDFGIERLVYSSSASVYGNALTVPMTEDHPFNNRTMYGATKIAGEQILRAFNETFKLPYIGYRYMNIYGQRMDYKGTYVSVIMKVLDRIAARERPVIFGDGSQSYDFIHVVDVARANILGMQGMVTDEFFNVGAGTRTSIKELVHMLLTLTNSTLEPDYRQPDRFYVTHRLGSIEKARDQLGFVAEKSLEEGLRELIAWRIAEGLSLQLANSIV